ncbi:Uridine kinase [Cystobasidiomycetes sp. EMM_F5]
MAIRVLLDHGVQENHIIFMCFTIAQNGGVYAVYRAFPQVRIVTSAVDPDLQERLLPLTSVNKESGEIETMTKRCWAILPGVGNFGSRYFGT